MSQTDYLLAEVACGVSVSDWSGHRNLAGCGVIRNSPGGAPPVLVITYVTLLLSLYGLSMSFA